MRRPRFPESTFNVLEVTTDGTNGVPVPPKGQVYQLGYSEAFLHCQRFPESTFNVLEVITGGIKVVPVPPKGQLCQLFYRDAILRYQRFPASIFNVPEVMTYCANRYLYRWYALSHPLVYRSVSASTQ